jgi:hypothetical protein
MITPHQTEFLKMACILAVAIFLLFFIALGLQESPYNEF